MTETPPVVPEWQIHLVDDDAAFRRSLVFLLESMGWEVTGAWYWKDGYFCRELAWGDDVIPYDCQLVEAQGSQMRFTSEQGTGDSASFRLR